MEIVQCLNLVRHHRLVHVWLTILKLEYYYYYICIKVNYNVVVSHRPHYGLMPVYYIWCHKKKNHSFIHN